MDDDHDSADEDEMVDQPTDELELQLACLPFENEVVRADIVVVGTSRTTQSTTTSSRTGTSIGREMGSRHRRVVATRRVWCDWRDDDGAADVSRDDRARSGVRVWRRGRRRIRVRRRE